MAEFSQHLLEGYIEKQVQYLGELKEDWGIEDIQRRRTILKAIDEARNGDKLKWGTSSQPVLFCMSAYNVKIKEVASRMCVQTFPLEQIAALSYVSDSPDHLLFLLEKTGRHMHCHVFNCPQRVIAEDICDNLEHVYSLLTSKENIKTLERGTRWESEQKVQYKPIKTRENEANLEKAVQEYMQMLNSVMTFDEIREFGSLVSAYRSEMPVEDFCTSLVKLYGSERRHLLKGMILFIPEEDRGEFTRFMNKLNAVPTSGTSTSS